MNCSFLQGMKVRCSYFMVCSAIILFLILGFQQHIINSYVYIVSLDNNELGIVKDTEEVEFFIEDLTERCAQIAGMDLELAQEITMVKELRLGSEADPEAVFAKISQNASFITHAYMINVDGKPFVPVSSKSDLEKVFDSLKEQYLEEDQSADIVAVTVLEDITLDNHTTTPGDIFTPEEVVALLTKNSNGNTLTASATPSASSRGTQDSRHSSDIGFGTDPAIELVEREIDSIKVKPVAENISVSIQTVEEMRIIETIPFEVEYVENQGMLTTEIEVNTPGVEGEKEVVYQIIRENGMEVERELIREEILVEPQTQVETRGTKEPPPAPPAPATSLGGSTDGSTGGTGRFVWPVQGKGTIYNGYRSGHRAIDIHIAHGTNVLAADSGVVTFDGYGSTQGNYLIIHHGAYWTLYLHNSKHFVKKGDRVSRGQVIAQVGTTGRAYGPHLHFEIRQDDGSRQWNGYYQHKAVNPLNFFNR